MARGFHSKDGFFFERIDKDGSVRISKWLSGVSSAGRADQTSCDVLAYSVTLAPSEWASVVASVSAKGETSDTWNAALQFHDEKPPTTLDWAAE